MKLYLQSSVHHLENMIEAEKMRKSEHDEIRKDDDGTFSIYRLTDKPVQFGQYEWRKQE